MAILAIGNVNDCNEIKCFLNWGHGVPIVADGAGFAAINFDKSRVRLSACYEMKELWAIRNFA